jgi:predicted GH43/DUF377 family glycosyl hydrolase
MGKIWFLTLLLLGQISFVCSQEIEGLVVANRRIHISEYPKAWNPSLIKTDQGYLLVFRYMPNADKPWISRIGLILLDDSFQFISPPQLLITRQTQKKTPSQAEDARIISYQGQLYLIYNDNLDCEPPHERRDMFIAPLAYSSGKFTLRPAVKLIHADKYETQSRWQKNWVPFIWKDKLLLGYSLTPHEILEPTLTTGQCHTLCATPTRSHWRWGQLRGGAPAQLVDGEYLAFFHSSLMTITEASRGEACMHYFMGAYTFSADPPFAITRISPCPIKAKEFYSPSDSGKKVIYPGGYAVSGPHIHLAYGRNDCEIWIATLDKERLLSTLKPLGNNNGSK